ncbi:hypothetical protein FKM82_019922 [Ascaphus truei]
MRTAVGDLWSDTRVANITATRDVLQRDVHIAPAGRANVGLNRLQVRRPSRYFTSLRQGACDVRGHVRRKFGLRGGSFQTENFTGGKVQRCRCDILPAQPKLKFGATVA